MTQHTKAQGDAQSYDACIVGADDQKKGVVRRQIISIGQAVSWNEHGFLPVGPFQKVLDRVGQDFGQENRFPDLQGQRSILETSLALLQKRHIECPAAQLREKIEPLVVDVLAGFALYGKVTHSPMGEESGCQVRGWTGLRWPFHPDGELLFRLGAGLKAQAHAGCQPHTGGKVQQCVPQLSLVLSASHIEPPAFQLGADSRLDDVF